MAQVGSLCLEQSGYSADPLCVPEREGSLEESNHFSLGEAVVATLCNTVAERS